MPRSRSSYSPAKLSLLRWLTDTGADVPPGIGLLMLGEMFASPKALLFGLSNGILLDAVGLYVSGEAAFGVFMVLDTLVVLIRSRLADRANRAARLNQPTPTDLFVLFAGSWSMIQGVRGFVAMQSGNLALELLSAATVLGLVGPICARNYVVPRYAMALVCFCYLPFAASAAFSHVALLWLMLLQAPVFLMAAYQTIKRFRALLIASLLAERDSEDRARHDFLTGLLNRFGLTEMLDQHFAAQPHRFILFYLDLDGFKPINDNFGHQAGDSVLRGVAERLRGTIRACDIVARLGGDEFVVVARDMSPEAGAAFAESMIHRLTDEPFMIEPVGSVRIGISIGFACAPEDGDPGDDLHRKADAALYEAKAAGKGVKRRFGEVSARARSDQSA